MSRFSACFTFTVLVVLLASAVQAHLLEGNRGPVDAFNYDESVAAPFKSAFAGFFGLPLVAKLTIIAVVVAAAFVIFGRMRNSASNNLRMAASLHEKANGEMR